MTTFTNPETASQAAAFLAFFAAAGVPFLNLAALVPSSDGGTIMEGGKRARDHDEIRRSLGWAGVRNRADANIYSRPARFLPDGSRAAWPIAFLDDLSPATAGAIARKYRSIVLETSSDNCQAWIVLSRPCSEHERHVVQSALARLVGADQGSTSGEHFGRMPGYCNRKPGRHGHRIAIRATKADGPTLDPTPHLLGAPEAVSTLLPPRRGAACPRSSLADRDAGDESAREFRFALARLAAGRPPAEVVDAVAAHALARGKRGGNEQAVRRYAELTVTKAAARL